MAAKTFTIEAIFKAVDKISRPLGKIKGSLESVGKSSVFKGLNTAADKGIKALGSFSNAIGIAGVASLAGLSLEMQNVMTKGAEFEKTLVRTGSAFETPVKIGSKAFADLAAAARTVGMTTEFSAQQAAEGLNSLATAGYTAEQSMAALPKIIDFASAAALELGQASDITSDTLGAFALRTDDAAQNTANMARIMDVLTRAAADSTTNVAELFEGVRAGGAFAKTAGASLEQFVALQGTLANKGIKGAEAGTAIRNAYLHLTSQTKQAAEAQAKLGVVTAKNRDGSIDMVTTIGRFSKATAKLSKDQKAAAISTIFGAFAVGPFLALMDAGADSVDGFTKRLEGAKGVTQEMAGAMRESTSAKIAKFFNVIDSVRLTVFDAIAPAVLDIADAVGKWVTANQELIGTKAAEWAAGLKENLPVIATWLERIAKALAAFGVLTLIVKTISAIVTVVGWLSAAWGVIQAGAAALLIPVAGLTWPIVAIGAAIAGLIALAIAYWPELSAFFSKLADWGIEQIGRLWDWVVDSFNSAKQRIVAVFEFVVGLATLIFAPFVAFAKLHGEAMSAVWRAIIDTLISLWDLVAPAFRLVWDGIVAYFKFQVDAIVSAWEYVATVFERVWQIIAGGFETYVQPLLDKLAGVVGLVRTIGRKTLGTEPSDAPPAPAPGPQVVSPQDRAAAAAVDAGADGSTRVDGTITVKPEPGTKADVKPAKANKVPIRLQPSGAW